jgi:putative tricarboxylic transport membrane protein
MRLPDRVTGLFLVGLGAAAAYGGWLLPPVPGQPVGPNVFPLLIGCGLALCGLAIAFGIGHSFEEEEEIVPVEGEKPPPRSKLYGLRALLPPALLLFYVAVAERVGFIITAAIIVFVTSTALGARWRLALPLAVLAPIVVHLIFSKLLRVPLPIGLLPMPW